MREKAYKVIEYIYARLAMISFFAGGLPIIPFIFALIVGGDTGEAIAVFLYKKYYPVVIITACIAVVVGMVGVYITKQHSLTMHDSTNE